MFANEKVLLPCFSHGIQYGVSGRSEQLNILKTKIAMAKLNVTVEQVEGEKQATVKVKFTNDVGKESIIESMKQMFEIEMYSAEIVTDKKNTTIIIQTECEEKLKRIRSGMIKTFREGSGLGNINSN